jgi:hypothetical protein
LDADRTNAILAALNKVVSLHFKETPIDKAIEDVRKATAGPEFPDGIPIYTIQSDPRVFGTGVPIPWSERKVTVDLDGVRLKTSLRLMLGQAWMAYNVKEGLLIIGPETSTEVSTGGMFSGGTMRGSGGGGFR